VLYDVGGVSFEMVGLNADRSERNRETSFAEHAVIGTAPVYEHTGENKRTVTISGKVHPIAFGGQGGLEMLETIRSIGEPVFVMRGDGTPLGWCVIHSIKEKDSYLFYNGQPQEIEHTIEMWRCDAPGVGGLFGFLISLF